MFSLPLVRDSYPDPRIEKKIKKKREEKKKDPLFFNLCFLLW